MATDILTLENVKTLVNSFYGKVRTDEMLAPIFNEVIQDRWPEHMEKMYTFWQTLLLGERTYKGNPFGPHAHLFITKVHFDQWLKLFYQTVNDHFDGEVAEEAKWRASRIAEVFQMRLDIYHETGR